MAKGSSPADPVRREYARLASVYDEKWRFYNEATARATLDRIEVAGTERVLDAGCGTGNLILSMRQRWPLLRCWGVDLCGEMLEAGKAKLGRAGGRLPLVQGRAERLPFAEGSFDLVISCNSLHFVPDPAQALSEFRRVLRPGGRLLVTDWCDDYLTCRLCSLLLRLCGKDHGRLLGGEELASLLEEAGFVAGDVHKFKINWLWGLMTASASAKRPASPPRGFPA